MKTNSFDMFATIRGFYSSAKQRNNQHNKVCKVLAPQALGCPSQKSSLDGSICLTLLWAPHQQSPALQKSQNWGAKTFTVFQQLSLSLPGTALYRIVKIIRNGRCGRGSHLLPEWESMEQDANSCFEETLLGIKLAQLRMRQGDESKHGTHRQIMANPTWNSNQAAEFTSTFFFFRLDDESARLASW